MMDPVSLTVEAALATATIDETAYLGGTTLIAAESSAAIGTASTIAGTALLKSLVGVGISVGLSYAANLLLAKQGQPIARNDLTIKQALPARFIDIGRGKTGGALFLYESPNASLFVGKVMTCDTIDEVEVFYLDDLAVTADLGISGTVTNGPWATRIIIAYNAGSPTNTVDGLLTTALPDVWDSSHRLRQLACMIVAYNQVTKDTFPSVYPNGPPNLTAVIRGVLLPDPRDPDQDMTNPATWKYADNAALAVLRFWLDRDGWNGSADDINLDSFSAAADICDETVDTTTSTEARYRAWGRYYSNDTKKNVLADLLTACAGRLIEGFDGKAALFVGKTPDPAVTLTEADILSISLKRFGDPLTRVGQVRPRIVSEAFLWQEVEAPTSSLASPEPDIANEVGDLALKFCPSEYQAQRLAKAELKRRNPDWTGSGVFKLSALNAVGERWINLQIDEYSINGVFEISRPAIDFAAMTVQLEFQSFASDTYVFAGTDMLELTSVPDNAAVDSAVNPPAGFAAVDSGASNQIDITWTDEPGYTFAIEYRTFISGQPAEAGWIAVGVGAPGSAITAPVATGTYDVRGFKLSPRGVVSISATTSVTIS